MCIVSNVINDMYDRDWPFPIPKGWPTVPAYEPWKPGPNAIPWPKADPSLAQQILDLIKRVEALDERLGKLENCKVAEPDKDAIKRALQEIVDKM